jgi:hypothetical protein
MLSRFTERLLGTPDESGWIRLTSRLTLALPIVGMLLAPYWLVPRLSFKDKASLTGADRDRVDGFIKDVDASVADENARLLASAISPAPQTKSDNKNTETKARFVFVPSCIGCPDYRETTVELTPLVRLLVKIRIDDEGYVRFISGHSIWMDAYRASTPEYYPIVRADNVVLMFLILVGLTLGVRAVRLSPATVLLPSSGGTSGKAAKPISAESFLEGDVLKAEERARDIYRRSTILLGGGIVMAFVGVALFYVTLPTWSPSESSPLIMRDRPDIYSPLQLEREYWRELYLRQRSPLERDLPAYESRPPASEVHPWLTFASHSLRPTGMLIFMEGIAWFLLRQYRVLIGEYKSFLRIYLKRSSYLIAWKAASSGGDKQLDIAHAMIRDDMNGTLRKDETTEVLETMRLNEPTPIIEVLREVKALIPALTKK